MMRLTISRKLLLIYFFMALLTVLSSTYAIISLQRINHLAFTLAKHDFILLNAAKQMAGILVDLESTEKKYLILKDPSIEAIYWSRSAELKELIARTRAITQGQNLKLVEQTAVFNREHADTFRREVSLLKDKQPTEAALLSRQRTQSLMDNLTRTVGKLQQNAETAIHRRLDHINLQGESSSRMTMILSTFSLTIGLILAMVITYNISRPLAQLKRATGAIAEGQFDYPVEIVRHDEIGSLANAFRSMKERLKILEARLRDASPLTGLPGNRAIEETVEKRLQAGKRFSLCHVDLDHFKPFADKYGYAWGSEVIKEVGRLIREKRQTLGTVDDFIGHVGGDDFIIIADPDRALAICRAVAADFDRCIAQYYKEIDRSAGFIVGKDRQGIMRKYPLISITIAIVTDDGSRFTDSRDMAQKAAELKEQIKILKGNNVVTLEEAETWYGPTGDTEFANRSE